MTIYLVSTPFTQVFPASWFGPITCPSCQWNSSWGFVGMEIQWEADGSFFHAKWGWMGPALLRDRTRGPKQIRWHHLSSLPKMTTFLDVWDFSAPQVGSSFPYPWKRVILYLFPASNLQAAQAWCFLLAPCQAGQASCRQHAGHRSHSGTGKGRVSPVPAALHPHAACTARKHGSAGEEGLCAQFPCCSQGRAEALLHLDQWDALAASNFFFIKTFPAARWSQCSISVHWGCAQAELFSTFPIIPTCSNPRDAIGLHWNSSCCKDDAQVESFTLGYIIMIGAKKGRHYLRSQPHLCRTSDPQLSSYTCTLPNNLKNSSKGSTVHVGSLAF